MQSLNTCNQDAHRMNWAQSQKEGKMKATQSEIKQNIQGTNSEGKETGTQINDLEQKEEINIQLVQIEATSIQKKKNERLRNLWDNFNVPTSES